MKRTSFILFLSVMLLFFQSLSINAQVTVGSGLSPEKGALLDIKEKVANIETGDLETARSGGLLMPRIYLSDYQSLAPLIDSSFILNNGSEYNRLKQTHVGLLVYNLTVSTVKNLSQGLHQWNGNAWVKIADSNLLTQTVEELKASILPLPAVFMLNSNKTGFLNGVPEGEAQSINMVQIVNKASDYIQLSADGTKLTFAPGLYLIQFAYEAEHNANCTLSSYFVDFPNDNYPSGGLRIHSNSSHDTFAFSNHGGMISAPSLLTTTVQWNIALGRGQAGNCTGGGMTLIGKSTFIYIIRYQQ